MGDLMVEVWQGDAASGRGRSGRQRSPRHQRLGESIQIPADSVARTRSYGRNLEPRPCFQDAGGQGFSQAVAINKSGYSVGYSDNNVGGFEGVLWSPTGIATALDAGGYSYANAINASGESVGYSGSFASGSLENPHECGTVVVAGRRNRASRHWRSGQQRRLALNNAGYSVGYSDNASGGTDAVMWSPKGERLGSPAAFQTATRKPSPSMLPENASGITLSTAARPTQRYESEGDRRGSPTFSGRHGAILKPRGSTGLATSWGMATIRVRCPPFCS